LFPRLPECPELLNRVSGFIRERVLKIHPPLPLRWQGVLFPIPAFPWWFANSD
jgi:hypothetical protein